MKTQVSFENYTCFSDAGSEMLALLVCIFDLRLAEQIKLGQVLLTAKLSARARLCSLAVELADGNLPLHLKIPKGNIIRRA